VTGCAMTPARGRMSSCRGRRYACMRTRKVHTWCCRSIWPEKGCIVVEGEATWEAPAFPIAKLVDTTGAGDALAAGYLVGGPELAIRAAARSVGLIGAMPSDQ